MNDEQPNVNSFFEKHKLIGGSKLMVLEKPEILVCRFCGNDTNTVSFRKKAHACPELLGRNNYVIFDECDSCNEYASKFESHLSKFFMPYLSILGIRGKRKIPKFQSRTINRNEDTRTHLKYVEEGRVNLILNKESIDDYTINKDEKSMSIRFRSPPLKPIYVYKALVKIALSFLPVDKLKKYEWIFDWLMERDSEIVLSPAMFVTTMVTKKWSEPNVLLYEANNKIENNCFYPELTLIVGFGNVNLQIFLPFSTSSEYDELRELSKSMELYPSFVHDISIKESHKEYKAIIKTFDLSASESTIFDEEISFKYEKADFND